MDSTRTLPLPRQSLSAALRSPASRCARGHLPALALALSLTVVAGGCTTERGAVAGPWPAVTATPGAATTAGRSGSPDRIPVDATDDGFSVDLFRNVVRGKVIAAFEALNHRDATPVLALMADDVHYTFEGQHALGGMRVSKAGVERWFDRLFRLLPSQFTLRSVEVAGWPWRSTAYIVFEDRVSPRFGDPYVNRGVQVVEMEWGKAVAIRTYVDTDKVVRALRVLAENGVAEATAAPITD